MATADEIERMFQSLISTSNSGLVGLPAPTMVGHRELNISLAPAPRSHRLPVSSCGLMAYETD